VLSARRSIVTVEEIVDRVDDRQGGVILPRWVASAVCHVPRGAFPSYAEDYYNRDNNFYLNWDPISRDRDRFQEWMDRYVLSTTDFAEFMAKLEEEGHA
jgi:glutaconate CoA-transferase subunit A